MNLAAISGYFSVSFLAGTIKGPMIWISFIIFGTGMMVQAFRLLRTTRKQEIPKWFDTSQHKLFNASLLNRIRFLINYYRYTVWGRNMCLTITSLVFHLCLFLTPIFLLSHNVLLENRIYICLPSFDEKISDAMTVLVIFTVLIFFLRRIVIKRVRVISTKSDFLFLFISAAPFLTGFMAFHNIYDYHAMLLLHILSAEIMLIVVPFSKLLHMAFFGVTRFLIVNEHSLGKPHRIWNY